MQACRRAPSKGPVRPPGARRLGHKAGRGASGRGRERGVRGKVATACALAAGVILCLALPRQAADEKLQTEVLKSAAVEFFKKANVDPEIWKSLVS